MRFIASFDSLRTRIVVFFAALLVLVQGLAFLVVNTANYQIAKETIGQELDVGARIFLRLLDQQRDQLEQSASLLASEFGFRQAVGTNDTATIFSALTNHGARASASVMLLISLDQIVLADTLHPESHSQPFRFSHLTKAAAANGKASGIVTIDGRLYQLVVVPVNAPTTIAVPITARIKAYSAAEAPLSSTRNDFTNLTIIKPLVRRLSNFHSGIRPVRNCSEEGAISKPDATLLCFVTEFASGSISRYREGGRTTSDDQMSRSSLENSYS